MSTDTTDRFRDAVGGRFPTASGISSARFWTSHDMDGIRTQDGRGRRADAVGESVPRPDRSLSTLRWLSIFPLTGLFGADHFYLRNPTTGLAKLLTLGGFGLWYLWDALQVGLEGDRVKDFGMSLPFDLKTGLGQGMVTDGPTLYQQKTSFAGWALATVFGFLGVDLMIMGQFWKGIAKLLYFIFFIAVLTPFLLDIYDQGVMSAIKNVTLFRMIMGLLMGFAAMGVGIIWINNLLYLLTDPKGIMEGGLPTPEVAKDTLGWWEQLYVNDIYCTFTPSPEDPEKKIYTFKPDESSQSAKNEYEKLIKTFRFTLQGISGEQFRNRFWISHARDDELPDAGPAAEDSSTGSPLLKIFFRMMQNAWVMFDKYVITPISDFIKLMFKSATPMGALTSVAEQGGLGALAGIAGQAGLPDPTARVAQLDKVLKNPAGAAGNLLNAGAGAAGNLLGQGAGAASSLLSAGTGAAGSLLSAGAALHATSSGRVHVGGARSEPMSTEAKIAAATVAALASAGALKGLIDFLVA